VQELTQEPSAWQAPPPGQPTSLQLRHCHWPLLQIGLGALQSEFRAQPTQLPSRQTGVAPVQAVQAPPAEPQCWASTVGKQLVPATQPEQEMVQEPSGLQAPPAQLAESVQATQAPVPELQTGFLPPQSVLEVQPTQWPAWQTLVVPEQAAQAPPLDPH